MRIFFVVLEIIIIKNNLYKNKIKENIKRGERCSLSLSLSLYFSLSFHFFFPCATLSLTRWKEILSHKEKYFLRTSPSLCLVLARSRACTHGDKTKEDPSTPPSLSEIPFLCMRACACVKTDKSFLPFFSLSTRHHHLLPSFMS